MATTITIEVALVPAFRDAVVVVRPADVVRAFLDADPTQGSLTWTTDLTAQELTTVEGIRSKLRSPLPTSLYDSVRPDIQTLRAFRQRSRNDFIALSQNDRDRALYDAQVATLAILLALLRE